ncbi:MAG TPA: YraN family protein [Dongiaceae bacterium]|nr:YraN family protein [Dongiaceae bacterium]
MNSALKRRQALGRGRRGERLALLWLRLRGYRILAHDHRTRPGEIDIIARRGRVLAFVEVKTRADVGLAAEALLARQRRRIARAAAGFLAARPEHRACYCRFDVVLVAPWRWPRHIADAWRPEAYPQ